MIAYHKADLENRMYLNVGGGKKIAMPRYYKLKLYDELERDKIGAAMRTKILLQEEKAINKYGLQKWEHMKEIAFLESLNQFNNNYKKCKL